MDKIPTKSSKVFDGTALGLLLDRMFGRKTVYRIQSIGKYNIPGRGLVFHCESPVNSKRSFEEMKKELGDIIEIDGTAYEISGIEMKQPGYPVSVGEEIGILVREIEERK
jgi:hypothetical protein